MKSGFSLEQKKHCVWVSAGYQAKRPLSVSQLMGPLLLLLGMKYGGPSLLFAPAPHKQVV